ncbi:cobalamin-binding protein [Phenylobacterium sp.]|uniref:cobalamin-binding protein n=1 Tax=Phenylobacterium sp. TaxID=1871053 RepID=UPI002810F9F3|nr:cobalamin-binding protein [Phenylobacterium sp.]
MTQRIVSLLPSATEIVAALGLAHRLVGRSHQCDFPAGVERLPALSSTKIRTDQTSAAIDAQVNEILRSAVSVYDVDTDTLKALQPDVILTQTQCAICAVTPADLEAALCSWTGLAPRLVSLEPNDLGDVWGDIRKVAAALGARAAGETLIAMLQARLAALSARVADRPRPTVAALEWFAPLMAGGNWMPELIEAAGGRPLFARPGQHSPWLSWDDLAAAEPDVILMLPCGFRLEESLADLPALTGHPLWSGLKAVREGRVYAIDGHHYFNRPGPRLVESAEIVAEILHPQVFQPGAGDFGHRGTGWVQVPPQA